MNVGDIAPDFILNDQDGTPHSLASLLSKGPVVLFFYPAAMTKGCTKESCYFRDLGSEFAAAGGQRIGISMDSEAKQAEFASRNSLDYPLLADPGGSVASLYGVKRGLDFLKVRRTTFVIDTEQRIRNIIASEMSMELHADRALETLRALH
jgi:peroxiredoxin Q/BCP